MKKSDLRSRSWKLLRFKHEGEFGDVIRDNPEQPIPTAPPMPNNFPSAGLVSAIAGYTYSLCYVLIFWMAFLLIVVTLMFLTECQVSDVC